MTLSDGRDLTLAQSISADGARYANAEDGYKAAIREVFSLAQSEARAAALRRLLQRQLVFTAQRRTDVEKFDV